MAHMKLTTGAGTADAMVTVTVEGMDGWQNGQDEENLRAAIDSAAEAMKAAIWGY